MSLVQIRRFKNTALEVLVPTSVQALLLQRCEMSATRIARKLVASLSEHAQVAVRAAETRTSRLLHVRPQEMACSNRYADFATSPNILVVTSSLKRASQLLAAQLVPVWGGDLGTRTRTMLSFPIQ